MRIRDQLLSAWDRGDGAVQMRRLVEEAGEDPAEREAARAAASSTEDWLGLWVGRIEHFEKVELGGGESATVTWTISLADLSFYGKDL